MSKHEKEIEKIQQFFSVLPKNVSQFFKQRLEQKPLMLQSHKIEESIKFVASLDDKIKNKKNGNNKK